MICSDTLEFVLLNSNSTGTNFENYNKKWHLLRLQISYSIGVYYANHFWQSNCLIDIWLLNAELVVCLTFHLIIVIFDEHSSFIAIEKLLHYDYYSCWICVVSCVLPLLGVFIDWGEVISFFANNIRDKWDRRKKRRDFCFC